MFLLLSVYVPWIGASNESGVADDLYEAEAAMALAYNAVWDAEEAGANVSDLFDSLNLGNEYLAEAYVWFRLGDSENAGRFASLCCEAIGDVTNKAVELRDEAVMLKNFDFVVKFSWSIVGLIVIVGGFVVWRVFRRRYVKGVLRLKPEVVADES